MTKLKLFFQSLIGLYISFAGGIVGADDDQRLISEYKEMINHRSHPQNDNPEFMSKSVGKIIDVETSHHRSFALTQAGHIWAWGMNWAGQLGDGTMIARERPVKVKNINDVLEISAGAFHTLALTKTGKVMAWGQNNFGQLGDGTRKTRTSPVEVQGIPDGLVIAVSAADSYSLALLFDGTVWIWGKSQWGEQNDGTEEQMNIVEKPTRISGLENIIDIDSGGSHSLALNESGRVWSWGENFDQDTPWQIPGLADIVAISTSDESSLALCQDGTVWAWGDNYFGQLGDGTYVDNPVSVSQGNMPRKVVGIEDAIEIEMGPRNGLVITDSRELVIWGANYNGQYGNGTHWASTTLSSQNPGDKISISGLVNVKAVSMAHPHVLALTADRGSKVWSWGGNRSGELGHGLEPGPAAMQTRPQPVELVPGIELRQFSGDLQLRKSGA